MKIPFDIKYRPQIESGEYKVVTRDGSPVRIICWDRKSAGDGQPIVALVENGHYENSIWVEENGVYKGTMGHEYDLFITTPEPELAESEDERIRKDMIEYFTEIIDNICAEEDIKHGEKVFVGRLRKFLAYLEKQKEQKPVEIHIDNPNIQKFDPDVKVTTSDSSAGGKELLYVSNKSYNIGYRDGVASVKPAEWSDEDEENLGKLHRLLVICQGEKKFIPSDEYDKLDNWLKSLRPQPKVELSEDVKKTLDEVSHILIGLNYKQVAKDYKQAIEELLYSRPSWKPSEEQMEALRRAVNKLAKSDVADSVRLSIMYDNLKKLM